MIIDQLRQELSQIREFGTQRALCVSSCQEAYVLQRNRKLINFTSWDYLGLQMHPALLKATVQELELSGIGSFATRTSTGTASIHIALEQLLAKFFQQQQAILFSSRNQALWSLLAVLLTEQDALIHSDNSDIPLADIASLVGARAVGFQGDLKALEKVLIELGGTRRRVLVIEGVNPISGEVFNYSELLNICARTNTLLIIDESFSLGAPGLRGAGFSDLSVQSDLPEILVPKPFCVVADLALTSGGVGACICGPNELIELIIERSSTLAREPSIPSAVLAGIHSAISVIELMHDSRICIATAAQTLSTGLVDLKLIESASPSPVICIVFKKLSVAKEFAQALFNKNILVDVYADPQARSEKGFVRLIVREAHTSNMIKETLSVVSELTSRVR